MLDAEFRINWPYGTLHPVRAHAFVQRDANEQPLKTIGTTLDMTELNSSQQSPLLFLRAAKQSPASVVSTKTRCDIEYGNDRFTRVTSYTLGEVLGKNPACSNPARPRWKPTSISGTTSAGANPGPGSSTT